MPPSRGPYALAFTPTLFLAATLFSLAPGCDFHFSIGDPHGMAGSGGDTSTPPPPDFSGAGQGGTCPTGSLSSGAGGGGGTCVGPDGTGQTAAMCDTMEITPSNTGGPAASNCDRCGGTGGDAAPPGYVLCLAGFELYSAGCAENLLACLMLINGAPAFACDLRPVADCVSRMYNEACPNQAAADTCQLVQDMLCGMNEPFDLTACTEQMKPLNDGALQRVAGCVANSSEPDCQTAYTTCFDQVTSY